MKKVSTDFLILHDKIISNNSKILIFIFNFRDHAITTVNSKNSEDLPAKHSRQHVSLFLILDMDSYFWI